MTKEEKELLLKDLCARLPYGVIISCAEGTVMGVHWNKIKLDASLLFEFQNNDALSNVKPYLRPMSSMTEEEEIVYEQLIKDVHYKPRVSTCCKLISWLKENYFDYNYLIEKGLALEALEGMYE